MSVKPEKEKKKNRETCEYQEEQRKMLINKLSKAPMFLCSHIIVKMYLTRLYKSISIYILFIKTKYIISFFHFKYKINYK